MKIDNFDLIRSHLSFESDLDRYIVIILKRAKDDGIPPKYIMFENVKNLVSKKFIDDFNNLLEVLDELGFNSYWKVIDGRFIQK